ncbi:hypothetical protein HHL26_08790 [Sphingobium sp. TB-6]|uniref:hypothetical protein n=1 Tax=Sphingobium sp. TB-6 TaxID=2728850 RepID=UPI00146E73C3|nr:hypothetical protein [Sphingobium sp. TB-6]NML89160.1 hypothetical protein [Sphingobium sp. TB-6]
MSLRNCPPLDSRIVTSRRALLHGLTVAPITASTIASPWATALASLHQRYEDEPATLVRTKTGRALSRDRYDSAEIALAPIEAGFFAQHVRVTLHQAGAIAKLALCAYLLDIGFPDDWNAAHIQQDIAKALAYANATGFGHDCPDMARLAVILSPYWKWGYPHLIGDPPIDDGGFTPDRVRPLVRALLDRVADGTGHPRPQGFERRQREVQS